MLIEMRQEFKLCNLGLVCDKHEVFVTSQWNVPRTIYTLYRLLLAVYTVSAALYMVIYLEHLRAMDSAHNRTCVVYLTCWSYLSLTCYYVIAAVTAVHYQITSHRSSNHVPQKSNRQNKMPEGLYYRYRTPRETVHKHHKSQGNYQEHHEARETDQKHLEPQGNYQEHHKARETDQKDHEAQGNRTDRKYDPQDQTHHEPQETNQTHHEPQETNHGQVVSQDNPNDVTTGMDGCNTKQVELENGLSTTIPSNSKQEEQQTRLSSAPQLQWYLKLSWLLTNISSNIPFIVTGVYFGVIFDSSNGLQSLHYNDVNIHVLNSVFVLIDLCISARPVRVLHFIYPVLFGIVYDMMTVIYWAVDHSNVVYSGIKDWNNPGIAIVTTLVIIVSMFLIQIVLFGIYRLRVLVFNKIHSATSMT